MKSIYYILIVIGAVLAPLTPTSAQQTCVKAKIGGFRAGTGRLYISIYDSQEAFLKIGKETATNVVVVNRKDTVVETCFSGLAPGWYAIALYHDEDDNKKMNTGLFGIPLEPYGLSNNFKPRFSYPRFEQCKFYVPGSKQKDVAIALITPMF
ncbi:MAG: uncharacterized protein JWO03_589 [Bacteroidetes bacterium]|nr:uncharacterized protein [Bacteroidota bacterium]